MFMWRRDTHVNEYHRQADNSLAARPFQHSPLHPRNVLLPHFVAPQIMFDPVSSVRVDKNSTGASLVNLQLAYKLLLDSLVRPQSQ